MYRVILILAIILIPLAGCGVNKDIHEAALQESEIQKTQLETTKSRLNKAMGKIEALKGVISEREGQIKALDDDIALKEAQADELSSKIDSALKEMEKVRQELSLLKGEKASVDEEVESLRLKVEDVTSEKEKEVAETKSTYESLIGELQGEISRGEIKITRAVDRLTVNLVDKILFDSGKVEIKGKGLEVLKRLGEILRELQEKQIRIEGHTDDVPIGPDLKEEFPTNWELSTRRAANVVRYLQEEAGIDPALLSATGYSEYRPIASNDTAEGTAENRRIEIVLLPVDVEGVLEELTQ
ncbi:MAG: OmpA family protein [Deltaproteobacteria bacterium]|nr:OmpA family protein [Deltaproteobacteria bacterium]